MKHVKQGLLDLVKDWAFVPTSTLEDFEDQRLEFLENYYKKHNMVLDEGTVVDFHSEEGITFIKHVLDVSPIFDNTKSDMISYIEGVVNGLSCRHGKIFSDNGDEFIQHLMDKFPDYITTIADIVEKTDRDEHIVYSARNGDAIRCYLDGIIYAYYVLYKLTPIPNTLYMFGLPDDEASNDRLKSLLNEINSKDTYTGMMVHLCKQTMEECKSVNEACLVWFTILVHVKRASKESFYRELLDTAKCYANALKGANHHRNNVKAIIFERQNAAKHPSPEATKTYIDKLIKSGITKDEVVFYADALVDMMEDYSKYFMKISS